MILHYPSRCNQARAHTEVPLEGLPIYSIPPSKCGLSDAAPTSAPSKKSRSGISWMGWNCPPGVSLLVSSFYFSLGLFLLMLFFSLALTFFSLAFYFLSHHPWTQFFFLGTPTYSSNLSNPPTYLPPFHHLTHLPPPTYPTTHLRSPPSLELQNHRELGGSLCSSLCFFFYYSIYRSLFVLKAQKPWQWAPHLLSWFFLLYIL